MLLDAAISYAEIGLSVIKTDTDSKRPKYSWKKYQTEIANRPLIEKWFASANGNTALSIVTGKVSGNLEILDFDSRGEAYKDWYRAIMAVDEKLVRSLTIERSQSGGYHVLYKCAIAVPGNMKLAAKDVEVSGPGKHEYAGKRFEARPMDGKHFIHADLVETRGEGGQFLCSPTKGYEIIQGAMETIPTITVAQRTLLIETAKKFNSEYIPERIKPEHNQNSSNGFAVSPWADFDQRGDVLPYLLAEGWTRANHSGKTSDGTESIWLVRPGKKIRDGHSAGLIGGRILKVFSSNAHPFEIEKSYSPSEVFKLLQCGGDAKLMGKKLRDLGFGSSETYPCNNSNLSNQCNKKKPSDENQNILKKLSSASASLLTLEIRRNCKTCANGKNCMFSTLSEDASVRDLSRNEIIETLKKCQTIEIEAKNAILNLIEIETYLCNNSNNMLQPCNLPVTTDVTTAQVTNITADLKSYIDDAIGWFQTRDVYESLGLKNPKEKTAARVALSRFVESGEIERHMTKNGGYRRIDKEAPLMDYLSCETNSCSDLILPLGLHGMVRIMPGNIILIAGSPNSGKTSLLLNIAKDNMKNHKTYYWNSEMDLTELQARMAKFEDLTLSDWHDAGFEVRERFGNFHDVIKPGKGNINIVDYLEVNDEFYAVGGMIRAIHERLDGAIAVIALQKDKGRDLGRGGMFTIEKPRLALAVDYHPEKGCGTIKIVKAKNFRAGLNPNGMTMDFNIVGGAKLVERQGWHR